MKKLFMLAFLPFLFISCTESHVGVPEAKSVSGGSALSTCTDGDEQILRCAFTCEELEALVKAQLDKLTSCQTVKDTTETNTKDTSYSRTTTTNTVSSCLQSSITALAGIQEMLLPKLCACGLSSELRARFEDLYKETASKSGTTLSMPVDICEAPLPSVPAPECIPEPKIEEIYNATVAGNINPAFLIEKLFTWQTKGSLCTCKNPFDKMVLYTYVQKFFSSSDQANISNVCSQSDLQTRYAKLRDILVPYSSLFVPDILSAVDGVFLSDILCEYRTCKLTRSAVKADVIAAPAAQKALEQIEAKVKEAD